MLGLLLALAAAAAGIILIAADFSTLYVVRVGTVTRESVGAGSHHSYALAVIGIAALVLAFVAARGGRPAAPALAVLGGLAVILGPIADRHVVKATGVVGDLFATASAQASTGYHLELTGSILLLAAGSSLVLLWANELFGWVGERQPRAARPSRTSPPRTLPENPFASDPEDT